MAIEVTMPSEAPTNITTTLVDGGSLDANTTYYYVMFSTPDLYNTPGASTRFGYHSPISAEGSFTTNTTQLSAKFNWDNPTGGAYYQILLTKTSGDYVGSMTYGGLNETMNADINDGVTGYTITDMGAATYIKHSIQLANELNGGISRDTGVIKIYISGADNTTYSPGTIATAIDSAGFSDCYFYDGYTFILKGWIVVDGNTTGSGSIIFENKSVIFIKGGVHNYSPTFITRFGAWVDDDYGANYWLACNIDLQHARYPFRGYYDTFQVFGSVVSLAKSRDRTLTEPISTGFYNGGGSQFLTYNFENVKDNILGISLRGVSSDVIDLKFGQGNNFGSFNHIRDKIFIYANMPYRAGGKFYACEFVISAPLQVYSRGVYVDRGYYSDLYDCKFPKYEGGEVTPENNNFYYAIDLVAGTYTVTDQYYDFNYSVLMTVLDEEGNALEGVNVNCVDKDGNPVEWEEKDGSFNQLVTGNKFTTDRTTDVNGVVDYYIKSYTIDMAPYWSDVTLLNYRNYDLRKTIIYPFTLTFSKDGYRDYSMIIEEHNEIFQGVITLEYPDPTVYVDGVSEVSLEEDKIYAKV